VAGHVHHPRGQGAERERLAVAEQAVEVAASGSRSSALNTGRKMVWTSRMRSPMPIGAPVRAFT
jgi:hypothetical protein